MQAREAPTQLAEIIVPVNRWGIVGVAQWFVAVGFFARALTLVNAFGQLFQADWALPIIDTWAPYCFAGSNIGQAYFVESVILIIGIAILTRRGLEGALHHVAGYEVSYLISYPLVAAFKGLGLTRDCSR